MTLVQIEGYIHWQIKKITVIAVEASTLNFDNLISTVDNIPLEVGGILNSTWVLIRFIVAKY